MRPGQAAAYALLCACLCPPAVRVWNYIDRTMEVLKVRPLLSHRPSHPGPPLGQRTPSLRARPAGLPRRPTLRRHAPVRPAAHRRLPGAAVSAQTILSALADPSPPAQDKLRLMNILMDDLRDVREFPIKACQEVRRGRVA